MEEPALVAVGLGLALAVGLGPALAAGRGLAVEALAPVAELAPAKPPEGG